MFRVAGRVQVNLMDAETGFFYAGSYLGTKKVLSIGASFDFQDAQNATAYKYFAGDVFVDHAARTGGRAHRAGQRRALGRRYDDMGQTPTIMGLTPRATAIMAEAGFLIGGAHLSPIVRAEHAVRQRRQQRRHATTAAALHSGPTATTRTSRPSTRTARRRQRRRAAASSTCSGSCTSSRRHSRTGRTMS